MVFMQSKSLKDDFVHVKLTGGPSTSCCWIFKNMFCINFVVKDNDIIITSSVRGWGRKKRGKKRQGQLLLIWPWYKQLERSSGLFLFSIITYTAAPQSFDFTTNCKWRFKKVDGSLALTLTGQIIIIMTTRVGALFLERLKKEKQIKPKRDHSFQHEQQFQSAVRYISVKKRNDKARLFLCDSRVAVPRGWQIHYYLCNHWFWMGHASGMEKRRSRCFALLCCKK